MAEKTAREFQRDKGTVCAMDPNMEIKGVMVFRVVTGTHHDQLTGNQYTGAQYGRQGDDGTRPTTKEGAVFKSGIDLVKTFGRKFERMQDNSVCNASPDGFALRKAGYTIHDQPLNPRLRR